MLKKKLGIEAIERDWDNRKFMFEFYKIPITLIIPDSCRRIGNYALKGCWELKKVKVSSNVKYIGDGVFEDCIFLEKVLIPEGVERIGCCAFSGCSSRLKVCWYAKEENRS